MVSATAEYLTTTDIARRYGVSDNAVRGWIINGVTVGGVVIQLRAMKPGKNFRIHPDDLDEFLRLKNPEEWARAALEQDRERREAAVDQVMMEHSLGRKRRR